MEALGDIEDCPRAKMEFSILLERNTKQQFILLRIYWLKEVNEVFLMIFLIGSIPTDSYITELRNTKKN